MGGAQLLRALLLLHVSLLRRDLDDRRIYHGLQFPQGVLQVSPAQGGAQPRNASALRRRRQRRRRPLSGRGKKNTFAGASKRHSPRGGEGGRGGVEPSRVGGGEWLPLVRRAHGSLLGAGTVGLHHELALRVHAVGLRVEESYPDLLWQPLGVEDVEAQVGLRRDLVDVLTPRAAAAHELDRRVGPLDPAGGGEGRPRRARGGVVPRRRPRVGRRRRPAAPPSPRRRGSRPPPRRAEMFFLSSS